MIVDLILRPRRLGLGAAAALSWLGGIAETEAQYGGSPMMGPGVRRVQASAPDLGPMAMAPSPIQEGLPPLPPAEVPSPYGGAPAPYATFPAPDSPDPQPYDLPAAENIYAAEQPTAEAAADQAEEAAEPRRYIMELFGAEESPLQIYGWIQNSFTANPSFPSDGINFGVTPNYASNDWRGNQYYTVFEVPLVQDDTINFGGRLDFLFGHDAAFNKMRGVFDGAFGPTQFAAIDLAQFYAEVHLPVLTEGGLDVKFGRWYTLHGYEVVPAVGRPLLSVPYMFTFGQPFTHWGLMTTWNVNDNLVIYNGSPQGWDRFQNENARYGYMGGFSYTGMEGKLNLTFIYSRNSNVFPRFFNTQIEGGPAVALQANDAFTNDRLNLWTTVLSYQWNDKLTQVLETDQALEEGLPLQATTGGVPTLSRSGNANWYSFGNWFLYEFGEQLTGVWRSEVFWDIDGVRTGFADRFYEMTLGMIYKPTPNLWIRPEARYDWSQFSSPYNGGVSDSQFTYGFDIILLY